MKKQLYKVSVFLLIITLSISCQAPQESPEFTSDAPNVIYIYADDLGYGELGSYGQEKIKTPYLDQLAEEGIRFTQHYTGTPVCQPARAILLTGKHAGHSYIRGNYSVGGGYDKEGGNMPLPEGTYTIGNLMQDAGYVTGGIGKWSLGAAGSIGEPGNLGFDYFYGYLNQSQAHDYYPQYLWENGRWDTLKNDYFVPRAQISKNASLKDFDKYAGKEYAPDRMTEKALSFINDNKDNPFFLYLPYPIPHAPITIPWESEAYNIYKANQIDPEAYKMNEGRWDTVAYYGDQGYTPHPQPRAAYAAMITQLDMYVGQIMKEIKELGLDENTIIMFSSDNGPTFNGGVQADFFNSAGGLRGLKMDLYEGGIRMPFIARWPGHIPGGKVTDHISAQYDMMATLADLVGVKPSKNDGISMLPVLLGNEAEQDKHDFLYFEYPAKGGQVAIRMGDWKGVKVGMINNPNAEWELYNLATDVAEKNDLAAQYPEKIKKLDSILQKEHTTPHIKGWEFINPVFSESKHSQLKEYEKINKEKEIF